VTLVSDHPGANPGTLWSIDDARVIDPAALGGLIDVTGFARKRTLYLQSVLVGSHRFAFVLYRAPRNFDGPTESTAELPSRTVRISAHAADFTAVETVTVVRPLVVLIHGTNADNDAWLPFPLWRDSANEVHGFAPGALPFQATRISFSWIWNAMGGVHDSAAIILPQLVTAIRDWREATGTAATQADVITHSFGGVVARQVVQTQPDSHPLSGRPLGNFRAAENWGHGSMHKLITLAAPHRGAASANATARLNGDGLVPGVLRSLACSAGTYIDRGALRDQMVLSPALRALGDTRVPGHAIAGSGRAVLDPTGTTADALRTLVFLDRFGGPYRKAAAANDGRCSLDTLANYVFNLSPHVPEVTGSGATCSVAPNYDLVVSSDSSLGLMPPSASTTAADLGLAGLLNHSALHDPAFGSAHIVSLVSDRVVFLLRQATTSDAFSHFPAVASVPPSVLEDAFTTEFSPEWLDVGSRCPAPAYDAACPVYAGLQVIPAQLRLEDATPAPLSVYGLLDGQWVLAHSPTSSAATSRNCPITLESRDPGVATIVTNEVTGAQAVIAAGPGVTTIQVGVKGGGSVDVPVTVTAE
jgi:hypothetical protein